MTILNAKVTIDTHDFQVSFMGVKSGQTFIRDQSSPWLSREFITALRAADDSLGFDMVTLSGKRVRMAYDGTLAAGVPVNNDAAINAIHNRTTHSVYSLSGFAPIAAINAMAAKNAAHQTIWKNIADIRTKLANSDITSTLVATLVGQLATAETNLFNVSVSTITGNVAFAEGNGCSITNWVAGDYADFQFEFIGAP